MGGPTEEFNMSDPINSANTIVRDGLTWAEALNMGNPMNSANTIVRDGLTWTARQGHLT